MDLLLIIKPVEMCRIAVDFYSQLYVADDTEDESQNELSHNLPCLTFEHKESFDSGLTFEEISDAVMGFSSGRTPGLDGLSKGGRTRCDFCCHMSSHAFFFQSRGNR